jgi:hypothetical protein
MEWWKADGEGIRTYEITHVAIPAQHTHALRECHVCVRRGRVHGEHIVEAALVEVAVLRECARVGAVQGLRNSKGSR